MSDFPIQIPMPATSAIPNQIGDSVLTEAEKQKAKEFEAMFLTQFVDEMLKTVDLSAAAGGRDMHMWRSFMSESMAKSIVDQGGFGLASNVEQMIAAYRQAGSGGNS